MRNSSTSVTTRDSMSEGRQPMRFEKKTNIARHYPRRAAAHREKSLSLARNVP